MEAPTVGETLDRTGPHRPRAAVPQPAPESAPEAMTGPVPVPEPVEVAPAPAEVRVLVSR